MGCLPILLCIGLTFLQRLEVGPIWFLEEKCANDGVSHQSFGGNTLY